MVNKVVGKMYTLGYVLKTNDQLTSLYISRFGNVVAHSMIYLCFICGMTRLRLVPPSNQILIYYFPN